MNPSPTNPSGTLLPPKLSIMIGLGLTPLFYFILRSAYHSPSLTPSEMAFLWAYAFFCVLNCLVAQNRSLWIQNHRPKWMASFWARFAVYMVLALGLALFVNFLKLSTFYDAVISKSIIFLLLPYLITSPRTPKTSLANQTYLRSITGHDDHEITLRMRPSRGFWLLAVSVAFVAGGIFLLRENPAVAWMCICFFGLGIPVGISLLWTGGYSLIVAKDGFTMVTLWRRFFFRWADVDDFAVINFNYGPRVGFDLKDDHSESSPNWRKRITSRKWLKEKYGRNAILPDDYGLAPDELCRLLVERRNRALADSSS
jgi:hypothetical protein